MSSMKPEIVRSQGQLMPTLVAGSTIARVRSAALATRAQTEMERSAVTAVVETCRIKAAGAVIKSGLAIAKHDVVPAATDLAVEYPFLAEVSMAIAEGFVRMVGVSAENTYFSVGRRDL